MLKKIRVADLRLGMHLHGFDGSWLKHPFWKTRFILDDPADLKAALASGIAECWIDDELGVDVAAAAPAAALAAAPVAAAPAAAAPAPAPPLASPPVRKDTPVPMAQELQRAATLYQESRAAVRSMFSQARMGQAIDPEECVPMVQEIAASVFRNPGAMVTLARLKTRDEYTYMHSVAVCALMVSLARELGMSEAQCTEAGMGGLMHDLGKAVVPLEVLNKPDKLTDEEFALVKTHPERGHALMQGAGWSEMVMDVCLHHHEKMDGSGYPHRLDAERISLRARMGAVCDVYDAITSDRPYKRGWDPADAIAKMSTWKGHFDPRVFAAFVKSVGIYPVGSLVRMASGKLGVVAEQNAAALTAPVVMLFFSTKANMPIPTQRLDLSRPGVTDRIVGREAAENWSFPQLNELWGGEIAAKLLQAKS